MKNKGYFPLFIDLSKKKILVVGAGKIALRRIATLLPFVEKKGITVVAPVCCEGLYKLQNSGEIHIEEKFFEEMDLEGKDLVLAITNDNELNQKIGQWCNQRGILVNVASEKELCDFYFPGIIAQDEMVIGITANGKDHKKAKDCKAYLDACMKEFDKRGSK